MKGMPTRRPETIGRMVMADLLTRPDFMMYATEQCTAVHYAEACAGFGAARLAGFMHDTGTLNKLSARYFRAIMENITNTANHVDANVYGILPLELYRQTRDETFFKQGIELADKQWKNPLPDGLTDQTQVLDR